MKIKDFELKMAEPTFFEAPDRDSSLGKYNALKSDLERLYAEWELRAAAME